MSFLKGKTAIITDKNYIRIHNKIKIKKKIKKKKKNLKLYPILHALMK